MKELVGNLGRVWVYRLDANEDLLLAIFDVVRRSGIQAGVILSITGALNRAVLQHFQTGKKKIGLKELEGPMEVSGHGIIGHVNAPERGSKPFAVGGYVHGEPYVHVHLTVTSPTETLCGHLMEGCTVRSNHPISHFTIMIAEIAGVAIDLRCYEQDGHVGSYHELRRTDQRSE